VPFPQTGYIISNPLTDGDPNAIVVVTTVGYEDSSLSFPGLYATDPSPVFVVYSPMLSKWCILHNNGSTDPYFPSAKYNVLVIKQ